MTRYVNGLSCIVALMTSLTLHLATAHYTTYTPELEARAGAVRSLRSLLQRERAWYRDNQAYTASLDELGDDLHLDPHWHFELSAANISGHPILMLEADNGRTHLCLNDEGAFFESSPKPLPAIPSWDHESE